MLIFKCANMARGRRRGRPYHEGQGRTRGCTVDVESRAAFVESCPAPERGFIFWTPFLV
jgi:hypothetical protein